MKNVPCPACGLVTARATGRRFSPADRLRGTLARVEVKGECGHIWMYVLVPGSNSRKGGRNEAHRQRA